MGRVAPNPVKPHVCEDADYLPHCETCGTIVYWSDDHQRFIHVMVALEPEARRTVADYWATCPECAVGKCGNCNGQAWDDETDAPIACPCWVDGHSSTTSK